MENLINNDEWRIPQRQSPAAIFIFILSSALNIIKGVWPFILIYIFKNKKQNAVFTFIIILVVFAFLAIISAFIRFWFYKFYIDNDNLVIHSGWLKKKVLTVPLKNIHAVHLEQSVWQRVLQVVKITIDSAGSEKAEVAIDALSMKKAEQLKTLLLSETNAQIDYKPEEKIDITKQIKLSTPDLIKLSITSNHLEAFAIILSLSLNLLDNIKDAFEIDSWGIMKTYVTQLAGQTTVVISILIIIVALVSIAVSVIRTVLRFYNFTIENIQYGWKISFGLINHQQKLIPFNKIQILSWRANWLRRKINFWLIEVQSIGFATAKGKQRLTIPATSLSSIYALSKSYQNTSVFGGIDANQIHHSYWIRRTLVTGVPVIISITLISSIWLKWNALWLILLIFYLAWYFYKWFKTCRWQANEEGLQLYTGVWGRRYQLVRWNRVQQVQVDRNPYQRTHQLASILFITAGGSLKLPYIPHETASYLADYVLFDIESKNESWM